MIELRKGISSKPSIADKIIDTFYSNEELEGVLYIGYPILFTGRESITLDALWISERYGVIIFDFDETKLETDRTEIQDKLYKNLESMLIRYPSLNMRREFLVNIEVISFCPNITNLEPESEPYIITREENLRTILTKLQTWSNNDKYKTVLSIIQNVIHLKHRAIRDNVTQPSSRGGILQGLEKEISNLDAAQERAVIEFHEGVHRIRGLAGSGKTIVLALKAAYLHTQYPNWKIAITFHTRSLKEQFRELIERFCIEKKGEIPDWNKIDIIQAWGGRQSSGIYYQYCIENCIEFMAYGEAKSYKFRNNLPDKTEFETVCDLALEHSTKEPQLYDAILVDEAQDLSNSFLKICYKMLQPPKRLIYAYDELQKLNEGSPLKSPQQLFGDEGKDTILKKCYRNSRPILVSAHGLGFGIYRNQGLVQFFNQPQLWQDIGYIVEAGELSHNKKVTLTRCNDSSPRNLEDHSHVEDLIVFQDFKSSQEQSEKVAQLIAKNLQEDELLYKDIIVINVNPYMNRSCITEIKSALLKYEINCHLAGDINADVFYEEGSVVFTGIHRAKGNEASMAYIINADYCYSGNGSYIDQQSLISRRNILFTAITRSKAWVRVFGIGDNMRELIKEYSKIKNSNFKLNFEYPSIGKIQHLNLIHRDISQKEKTKIKEGVAGGKALLNMVDDIKNGRAVIENYPEEIQHIIRKLLK